jgi:hypothetical protein
MIEQLKEKVTHQIKETEEANKCATEFEKSFRSTENQLRSANTHVAQLLEETEAQCAVLRIKDSEIDTQRRLQASHGKLIDDLSKAIRVSKDNESAMAIKEKETRLMLEMQMEQAKELEARLEQALMRW